MKDRRQLHINDDTLYYALNGVTRVTVTININALRYYKYHP